MAIIGSGDIAGVLPEREDLLFFASGVSNSREDRESEYQREIDLLAEQPRDAHIVYFSSLAVLNGVGRYVEHKRSMEARIKEFDRNTIVRIGNIAWGTNPHTLINHFRGQIEKGEELNIQDTHRYVVDKDEFLYWLNLIPEWNTEMNIPGKRMKVAEIVDEYCYVGLKT
jgi:hypothetical protein